MYHILPQRGVGAPHFDARCAEEAGIRSIRAVLPQGSRYSSIAQYFDKDVVVPLPKTKTFANSMFAEHIPRVWFRQLLQLIQRDVAKDFSNLSNMMLRAFNAAFACIRPKIAAISAPATLFDASVCYQSW